MFKHQGGWQASRAISCLPALTGQYGISGGGLGPRHRGGTHGEGPADITAAKQRPPGDVHPEPHAVDGAGDAGGADRRPAAARAPTACPASPTRDGLAAGLDRVGTIVCHDLFQHRDDPPLRRHRPAGHLLAGGGRHEGHRHPHLPDRPGARRRTPRPARWPAFISDLARRHRPLRHLPLGRPGGRRQRDAGRPGRRRPDRGANAPDGRPLRAARSRTSPTPTTGTRRRPARSSCTPSGPPGSGCDPLPGLRAARPRLPETAPELAARYPLVFKQGRTFTSFHGFYDEARALPSLAKVNPGPELWISPTDAPERGDRPRRRHRDRQRPRHRRGEGPRDRGRAARAWSGCATAGSPSTA